MNLLICYSPTDGTKKIAQYVSTYLKIPLTNLTSFNNSKDFDYSQNFEYTIFGFPVYSQNIPNPVKEIISKLKSKYTIFLITYGRMGIGNVLYEASLLQNGIVIGGAFIPTKHTYKDGDYFTQFNKLDTLLDKVSNKVSNKVKLPRLRKNLFANLFPNFRSRIGVKLIRTTNCINCGKCNNLCPTNSIDYGIIDKTCIRCLSCYYNCEKNGLEVNYSKFLKMYLKKDKINELIIY